MSLSAIVILIVVVVLAAVIAFALVPYLMKKGFLNQGNVDVSKQFLSIVESLLAATHIGNVDHNHQIFAVCERVVLFIEQTMKDVEPESKKARAVELVEEVLESLHIEVSDKIKTLIEVGIESTVKLLPKTNN
jgi:hypothetical protein